jgi:iron(III) transport system permease protein
VTRSVLRAASMIAAAIALLPIGYLLVRGSGVGIGAWRDLAQSDLVPIMLRSVALAVCVGCGAVLVAAPLAFLVVRTNLPARRLWAALGALPMVIPSYVGALAFVGAFGPRGMLQQLLAPLGVERLPELYGFGGAMVTLILFTYPYVLLLVTASLRRVDSSLERAARGMGASQFRVFRDVVVPQIRSSMVAGMLLAMLYTLGDFGVVSIMRVSTFTREIYLRYNSLFDASSAAMLGLILCVVTLVILVVERRSLRGTSSAQHARRGSAPALREEDRIDLGRWKIPAVICVASLVGGALIVPIAVLVWWLVTGTMRTPISDQLSDTALAVAGSVSASGMGAIAAAALAIPVGVLCVRAPGRLSRLVESITYAGYALPGLVVALGLVYAATRGVSVAYGTIVLLVLAYAIRFMPQNIGATRAAIERIDPRLEAAGRGMGRSGYAVFRRVTLPLALPGIAAGVVLTFLTALKELPATLVLRPIGFETLATQLWKKTAVSNYPEAALPALVLIAVGALPLYLLVIRPSVADASSGSATSERDSSAGVASG